MRTQLHRASLLIFCACAAATAAHAQGRLYIKFHDATGKNAGYSIILTKVNYDGRKTQGAGRVPANRTEWANVTNFVDDESFYWADRYSPHEYWNRSKDLGPRAKYLLEVKAQSGATMFKADLDIFLLDGSYFMPSPEKFDKTAESYFGMKGSVYIEFFYPWAQDKAPWRDKCLERYTEKLLPPVQVIAQITHTDVAPSFRRTFAVPQNCCGAVVYEDVDLTKYVNLRVH